MFVIIYFLTEMGRFGNAEVLIFVIVMDWLKANTEFRFDFEVAVKFLFNFKNW